MHKLTVLVSAAIGALTVLVPAPAVHAATPVRCGDTITTDVVLTRDLTCSGTALRVSASGVTVDLAGHRLRGDGTGTGIDVGTPYYVDDVTVTGGRIENFDIGVNLRWYDATLHDLTVVGNRNGVVGGLAHVAITDSVVARNDVGMVQNGLTSVAGSTFRGNGEGILCRDANLSVVDTRFSDNGEGVDSRLCGVVVGSSSFVGGAVGLSVQPLGFGMDVRGNTFKTDGIGVLVKRALGGVRTIADNEFTDNAASGLVVDNEPAWPGVQVSGNVFKGNGFAPGANVDPAGNPLVSGAWSDDGTTFTGNQAIGNAGHGIEAYGATDGGGNSAWGNGLEPQCVGIVCAGP